MRIFLSFVPFHEYYSNNNNNNNGDNNFVGDRKFSIPQPAKIDLEPGVNFVRDAAQSDNFRWNYARRVSSYFFLSPTPCSRYTRKIDVTRQIFAGRKTRDTNYINIRRLPSARSSFPRIENRLWRIAPRGAISRIKSSIRFNIYIYIYGRKDLILWFPDYPIFYYPASSLSDLLRL